MIQLFSNVEMENEISGISSRTVVITTAEDYKNFQELIQRGANLWPDAPASIKRIADLITNGKILQEYRDD